MARGIALTIGLNAVDPAHYEADWSGKLYVAEDDAIDIARIAAARNFECTTLLTGGATRGAVLGAIAKAAAQLQAGDTFLLSYSGHGGQLPDLNADELDFQDETWCLFDGQLVDDELYASWGGFAAGVQIFMLSDSCHSGTMDKTLAFAALVPASNPGLSKAMPPDVVRRVYQNNRAFYEPILKSRDTANAQAAVKASVILISACRDDQLSYEGNFNGVFTSALKSAWNEGAFRGSYQSFHAEIMAQIANGQVPVLSTVGARDLVFAARTPFSI